MINLQLAALRRQRLWAGVIGVACLLWADRSAADLRALDRQAYQAAATHNSIAAFHSYLKHCTVCAHRRDVAARLSKLEFPQPRPTRAEPLQMISRGVYVARTQRLRLVTPGEQSQLMAQPSNGKNDYLVDFDRR